jgi:hypothetical protein
MRNKITQSQEAKPKTSPTSPQPEIELQSGQIWKAGETYVHIKEAGARLVHYKMATTLHRPGLRRHLSSVKTVQDFLKSRGAELMPGLNCS